MGWMDSNNTTTSSSEFKPPDYLQGPWEDWTKSVNTLSQTPAPDYQGQKIAAPGFASDVASDMGYNLATGGSPAGNMGRSQIAFQAGGGQFNPYAATMNPYMGNSPELQRQIDYGNADITGAYRTGTAAQLDAGAARQGAFGGSAYGEQLASNEKGLADAIARNTSNLRYQDYTRSGDLAENAINRTTQAFEDQGNRSLQAAGMGVASEGADWDAIHNLDAIGKDDQAYQQSLFDQDQQDFMNKYLHPFNMADYLGGAFSRASGQGGTTSASTIGAGYSPFANAAGLAGVLAGSGLFKTP